jgi:GrpB-like predicted nucleotidyltransferase (UPF0157 family)
MKRFEIAEYDPRWPWWFDYERARLALLLDRPFTAHEHIGSTAIPGLPAKPIIDMMASYRECPPKIQIDDDLNAAGYEYAETGMRNRFLYRKASTDDAPGYHLHLVHHSTWDERKERVMRDYLRRHDLAAQIYGLIKMRLAARYPEDLVAYTKAKTPFIQKVLNAACDELGVDRIEAWTD